MSQEETAAREALRGLAGLAAAPFTMQVERALVDALPGELAEPAEHVIAARIELLTAAKTLLEKRIEVLESLRKRARERAASGAAKREKVAVE